MPHNLHQFQTSREERAHHADYLHFAAALVQQKALYVVGRPLLFRLQAFNEPIALRLRYIPGSKAPQLGY